MKLYDKNGKFIKPDLPPPGPENYYEKGFPAHDPPRNWWQRFENWLFTSRR